MLISSEQCQFVKFKFSRGKTAVFFGGNVLDVEILWVFGYCRVCYRLKGLALFSFGARVLC